MKIAILYICTGKYDVFWKEFYSTCEQFFLEGMTKEYFVFTEATELFAEDTNPNIHKIYQERMGWPNDTLLRFQLFASIEKELRLFDYIFFFNANIKFLKAVYPSQVLPTKEEKLAVVLHPGYYNSKLSAFTYESKQKESTAYIPKGKGDHYYAGGLNGGIAEDYLTLIKTLKANIETDLKKNIVAVWHDESHLNHYMLDKEPKILSPSFLYPEGWELPLEPIIFLYDKANFGGHNFMRGITKKTPVHKRIKYWLIRRLRSIGLYKK